jgi:AAA domain
MTASNGTIRGADHLALVSTSKKINGFNGSAGAATETAAGAACIICGRIPKGPEARRCRRGHERAWCSNSHHANGLIYPDEYGLYEHALAGRCGCDRRHGVGEGGRLLHVEVLDFCDLMKDLGPQQWFCRELAFEAAGRPHVVFGKGSTRKSWFGMAMQICGATNQPLLGFPLPKDMKSIYVDWEQGKRLTMSRMRSLGRGYKVDPRVMRDRVRYAEQPVFCIAPKDEHEQVRVISTLSYLTEGMQLAFVDALFSASGVDDDKGGQASRGLRILKNVSARTGVTFLVNDHEGWGGAGRQRGHSSKEQLSGTLLNFRKGTELGPTSVHCRRAQGIADEDRPNDFAFTVSTTAKDTSNESSRLELTTEEGPSLVDTAGYDLLKLRVLAQVQAEACLTGRGIIARVTGSSPQLSAAIEELEAEGKIENIGIKGARKRASWQITTKGKKSLTASASREKFVHGAGGRKQIGRGGGAGKQMQ